MSRTKTEFRREAGRKAAETRRREHEKWEEAGKKSWDTRKKKKLRKIQKKIGHQTALKRKANILAVQPFLASLKKTNAREDICIVCGESTANSLDHHHLDGDRKNNDPSNIVMLCASCHRVLDKAKSPEEALLDLKERHREREREREST